MSDMKEMDESRSSGQIHSGQKKLMTLLPSLDQNSEMTLDMLIGDMSQIQLSQKIDGSLKEAGIGEENSDEERWKSRNEKQRQGFNDMFYFSEEISIHENVQRLQDHTMSEEVRKRIRVAFKRHFVFSNLEDNHVEQVISRMFACTSSPEQTIFTQNDEASLFFFIERGNVCIFINEEFKKSINENNSFGELALLYNSPRSATIKAGSDLILWAIDRITFLNVIKHINQQDFKVNRRFLENVSFFSNFTHEQKDLLASQFTYQKFFKGQTIVNIGDDANSFYIIKHGQVAILNAELIEERFLKSGDWFGESSLYLKKNIRTKTVIAKCDDVILLALSRKATQEILGDQIQYLAFRNLMRWAFEKDKILCKLIMMQREKLFSHMNIRKVNQGEDVINKERAAIICVVLEGQLFQPELDIRYEKAQVVGSSSLIQEQFQKEWVTVAEKDSLIAEIDRESMEQLLGGSYECLVTRNRKSHENSPYFSRESEKKLTIMQEDLQDLKNAKLTDLIYIKELGRGNFGSVNLVYNSCRQHTTQRGRQYDGHEDKHKLEDKISHQKDRLFAVKRGIQKYILREKSLLQKCNFPFIMKYFRAFYDYYHIYFMTEFINGIDFFAVMRIMGLFNKKQAQFYTAFIILTLQYLNNQGIVYRDLKPENILIDDQGWPKLVDMGTAKCLYDQTNILSRTYTLVGTPHYMAPEVILQKGYGFNVDLYSLGVILYELVVGYLPYGEDVDDPIEVYQLVIEGKLGFPNHMKNRLEDKKLIAQLMAKSPEVRLGGSYGALKSHEWFADFDWDMFFNKEMNPPFVPENESVSSEAQIQESIQLNSKNSFQTIMMIQSAQSGRYEKQYKITKEQTEFLTNFAS